MSLNEILPRLASATPAQLEKVAAVLNGKTETENTDCRLLNFSETATALHLSRATIWRMVQDGILPTVEVRAGRHRVPAAAVFQFASGRKARA